MNTTTTAQAMREAAASEEVLREAAEAYARFREAVAPLEAVADPTEWCRFFEQQTRALEHLRERERQIARNRVMGRGYTAR